MNELLEIVELSQYKSAIKTLVTRNKIIVDDDEIDDFYFNIFNSEKEKAKVSFSELISIINSKEEVNSFINYVSKKLVKYDGCDEQEYPEGEEPDEDEKDIVISEDGFSKTFLAFHLIEYCVLKNNRDYIDEYVKLIKIPNAKKYAKELKEIYDNVHE